MEKEEKSAPGDPVNGVLIVSVARVEIPALK